MNKISPQITITDIDALSDTIVRRIDESGITLQDDKYIYDCRNEISTRSDAITEKINSDRIVSEQDKCDKERTSVVDNIFVLNKGYCVHPKQEISESANNVQKILDKYKGMTRKSYSTKSSLITSLIGELESENISSDVAKLDAISDLVLSLKEKQTSFEKTSDEYTNAKLNKGKNATELKRELLIEINTKLVPYLTAMQNSKNERYMTLVAQIESAINKANDIANRRTQNNASSKSE